MIVPFSKPQPDQDSGPQRPKLPDAFLLAALGQAHAEGKFHVYDPALRFQSKDPGIERPVPPSGQTDKPGGIDQLRKLPPSERQTPAEKEI